MIISTDADKAFDKVQHCVMIKALNKLEIQGIFPNLMKDIDEKPLTTSYLRVKD